jgi:hypothetical protein
VAKKGKYGGTEGKKGQIQREKEGKICRRKGTTDTRGEMVGTRNRKRGTWKQRTERKNEQSLYLVPSLPLQNRDEAAS